MQAILTEQEGDSIARGGFIGTFSPKQSPTASKTPSSSGGRTVRYVVGALNCTSEVAPVSYVLCVVSLFPPASAGDPHGAGGRLDCRRRPLRWPHRRLLAQADSRRWRVDWYCADSRPAGQLVEQVRPLHSSPLIVFVETYFTVFLVIAF